MKYPHKGKWFVMLLLTVLPAWCAPAAAAEAEPAFCFFTQSSGEWGDDPASPAFDTLEAAQCADLESLYVLCRPAGGDWMQYKQAEQFRVEVILPGENASRVSQVAAPQVWMLKSKPLKLVLWKPGEDGLDGDVGIDTDAVEAMCRAHDEEAAEEKPGLRMALALGRAPDATAADEDGGEGGSMVYEHIAHTRLALDAGRAPAMQKKPAAPPPPPNADAVKDALRMAWPNRYPSYEFLYGDVFENPSGHDPANSVFSYDLSFTVRDIQGRELNCSLEGIMVRRQETGPLIVEELYFDEIQHCN